MPIAPELRHQYISTACQHGKHCYCRKVCKYCAEQCKCSCHVTDESHWTPEVRIAVAAQIVAKMLEPSELLPEQHHSLAGRLWEVLQFEESLLLQNQEQYEEFKGAAEVPVEPYSLESAVAALEKNRLAEYLIGVSFSDPGFSFTKQHALALVEEFNADRA